MGQKVTFHGFLHGRVQVGSHDGERRVPQERDEATHVVVELVVPRGLEQIYSGSLLCINTDQTYVSV